MRMINKIKNFLNTILNNSEYKRKEVEKGERFLVITPESVDVDEDLSVKVTEDEEFFVIMPENLDEDFLVSIPEEDTDIDESDLNQLREEFGDYDPTLDLSHYSYPTADLFAENKQANDFRLLIESDEFQNSDAELPVVLGKASADEVFVFDLASTPYLLVAGATEQGKFVGLNAILVSLLYKKHPSQVKFVLVDPKKVELTLYNRIERHFLAKLPGEGDAIITDTSKVVNTLNSLCIEMDDRYELLKDAQCRTIKEYNAKFMQRRLNPEKGHRYLPYIVLFVNGFDLLINDAEFAQQYIKLVQKGKDVGLLSVGGMENFNEMNVKILFPNVCSVQYGNKHTWKLFGNSGEFVDECLTGGSLDKKSIEKICDFIGEQRAYPEALLLPDLEMRESKDFDMSELDPMFADGARLVVIHQQGSAAMLQRKLKLGYNRAGRIIDQLEGFGIIGPFQFSKAREVLFSDVQDLDEFLNSKGID